MGEVIQLFPQLPEPNKAERLVACAQRILETTQQLYPYYLDNDLLINGWQPIGFYPKNDNIFLQRHAAKNQHNYYIQYRDEKSFHNDGQDGYVVYGRVSDVSAPFQTAVHLFYKQMTWLR